MSQSAGALEFTPHVVGTAKKAIGVNSLAVSDMDNDGRQDIVSAGTDGVRVYQQQQDKTFKKVVVEDLRTVQVYLADFDKDGLMDIIVTKKEGTPAITWYHNLGDLSFSGTEIGSGTNAVIAVGDIDKDGDADIASAVNNADSILLQRWMNDGSGNFTATTLDANSGVTTLAIGDINADSYGDIVLGGSKGLQRYYTTDGSSWTRSDIDEGNANKSVIAIGDVNGDDKVDIVTGDQNKNQVAYYRNQDNSTWQRIQFADDLDTSSVAIADLDSDGHGDIIVNSQDDNIVYWYRNDGQDTFKQITLADDLQSAPSVVVADISGDGTSDFVTADLMRGTIYYYQRIYVKPAASVPDSISQSTDGSGRIIFSSTISDKNQLSTRLRVQYSFDGVTWYKPWLTKVAANTGSVDLKNSNGYQVGTTNPIDTDVSNVELTFTWDTKSVENTGGPLRGDIAQVQLRLIPKDSKATGSASLSGTFRVDNQAPTGASLLLLDSFTDTEAQLSWSTASDSSSVQYTISYGTDAKGVANKTSSKWDTSKDEKLSDRATTSTTITDLEAGPTYYFKLFARDQFGNETGSATVSGKAGEGPTASATPLASITPEVSPLSSPDLFATPTPSSGLFSSTPSPTTVVPPTTEHNKPPVADAGSDQVVNPKALVILDGTASSDLDNETLAYSWRQLDGPPVQLLSDHTATPSFSAEQENATYIFSLTVRDPKGASASDTVTVATKSLPPPPVTSVTVTSKPVPMVVVSTQPFWITGIASPANIILLILSLVSTGVSLVERMLRSWQGRQSAGVVLSSANQDVPKGKVVHYKTGEPIAGVEVLVYGSDGKLRATERTNSRGEFPTLLPAGDYTLGVEAPGFMFTPPASNALKPETGILYSGGKISVSDSSRPLQIVIPMKPTGVEISAWRVRMLHLWQSVQHSSRLLSWPLFLAGAMLNTVLIFIAPSFMYLAFEFLYVVLVIIKVALEIRVRPAYGLVRDAITHVPLDLAVVRLFESGTNRLIMTRVASAQGKFFALPPQGKYTITITRPGYAVFSKDNVAIAPDEDSTLQLTADLMPVAPSGGLTVARSAIL